MPEHKSTSISFFLLAGPRLYMSPAYIYVCFGVSESVQVALSFSWFDVEEACHKTIANRKPRRTQSTMPWTMEDE